MNRIVNLTNINRDIANNRQIKYIVIHYVGSVSTAQNNANYFKNANRQASANYFIDEKDCVQVVEDKNISWHCGSLRYKNDCRNQNSIGIEMCCKNNGQWYFEQATINNTIELVKELMKKYNIPVENVIRHYDVTGKNCPEPFVRNEQSWNDFKALLIQGNQVIPPALKKPTYMTYIVKFNHTNVRPTASLFNRPTRQLNKGDEISVFDFKNGFLLTDIGYVHSTCAYKK